MNQRVLRIGEVLIECGAITESQRDQILEAQKARSRPFGDIAERLFNVKPEVVEDAWAAQYAQMADHVDARRLRPDSDALALISARQARQFGVLPVELGGGELMVCTTEQNLVRALRFVGWKIGVPAYFVLADHDSLEAAIERHYQVVAA